MELVINNKILSIDYDCSFSESVSVLKKKKSLSLKCTLYLDLKKEESNEIVEDYIKNLEFLPYTVCIKKSNVYHWVFNDCKLLSKSVKSEYYKPWELSYAEEYMKWNYDIWFSYEEVFGTNKPNVVKREIALNNLFGRD
jgi:hypothetical protein